MHPHLVSVSITPISFWDIHEWLISNVSPCNPDYQDGIYFGDKWKMEFDYVNDIGEWVLNISFEQKQDAVTFKLRFL